MLDYMTAGRNTKDNGEGAGYAVVQRTRWGTYSPISSPFKRGARKGVERRAVRRMILAKNGSGYSSGFHIYTSRDGALKRLKRLGATNAHIVEVKYRGRICHGIENGERVTVAKYRTIL